MHGEIEPENSGTADGFAAEVSALRQAATEAFTPEDSRTVSNAMDASIEFLRGDGIVSARIARLLICQHADAAVIAATLLGPVRARGHVSIADIETAYGVEIATLVEGAQRISPLHKPSLAEQREEHAELLRSTASDLRLLVAQVATRIIDLELPGTYSKTELRHLAQEGRELLVPLADRIGLGVMRGRLEDACFRVLEPEIYRSVKQAAESVSQADDLCLNLLIEKVVGLLAHHGIGAEVQGRAKSLWSLYRKGIASQSPVEHIMDRLGARVIVASVPECYTVLGILHRHFRPIPGTFRDYVGLPKENGYQSLHSCVYPLREISAKPVEFQIRTRAMHAEAEFGAAAHWLYKSREESKAERSRQRRWFEEVASLHATTLDHSQFIERLERLTYEQSLVVFLRGGEQVRVAEGSTALDLVTTLSEHPAEILSVRINSKESSLDTPLKDGDTVEWDEEVPQYLKARSPAALQSPKSGQ